MDLMQHVVPLFEASDSVFRYAWFEAYGDGFYEANTNEVIFEHAPKESCGNKKWLAGRGSASWQVQTMKECLAKADQDTECHSPVAISLDDDNCYCAKDACADLGFAYDGMHTWREVGQRDNSALTSLGQLYQTNLLV
mmetsp:Transcript_26770/g.34277  ORF Transcript_26770/g.34277 Transcript_26770/m.34277 type:complete len:138 (+) Transcript_26770:9-422(+)